MGGVLSNINGFINIHKKFECLIENMWIFFHSPNAFPKRLACLNNVTYIIFEIRTIFFFGTKTKTKVWRNINTYLKKLKFATIAPNVEQVFTSAYNVNRCISLIALNGILVLDVVIILLLVQL
jgi:hypothetical protein